MGRRPSHSISEGSATSRIPCTVCAIAFIAVSVAARAADPLGLYIGGSLGEADVRSKDVPLTFAGIDLGWKVFVGARPISFAGIELAYANYGHANTRDQSESVLAIAHYGYENIVQNLWSTNFAYGSRAAMEVRTICTTRRIRAHQCEWGRSSSLVGRYFVEVLESSRSGKAQ
jgi:hypothetical protein